MRVQVRRRGGFAGVTLVADLDTATLDSKTAARVEEALAQLSGVEATPADHPDAFEYEFIICGRKATVGEDQIPGELEPLLELLSKIGSLEGPPGGGRSR